MKFLAKASLRSLGEDWGPSKVTFVEAGKTTTFTRPKKLKTKKGKR